MGYNLSTMRIVIGTPLRAEGCREKKNCKSVIYGCKEKKIFNPSFRGCPLCFSRLIFFFILPIGIASPLSRFP
jgi:hypothetical protein